MRAQRNHLLFILFFAAALEATLLTGPDDEGEQTALFSAPQLLHTTTAGKS
jgi:hypothetical protein